MKFVYLNKGYHYEILLDSILLLPSLLNSGVKVKNDPAFFQFKKQNTINEKEIIGYYPSKKLLEPGAEPFQ